MAPSQKPSSGLLARARAGDAGAFAGLFDRHRNALFAFLVRSCGDADEAEDLLQLTAIKAWRGLDAYEDRGRFGAWLFTLARRTMIDEARRATRARRALDGLGAMRIGGGSRHGPDADLEAGEVRRAIEGELSRLTEERRTVFLLRHHSPLTFREIAEALDMPLGTALSHMHHATNSLKKALRSHDVSLS
ncbi:MAG: RNA polymerase sigma factor [Gemmatimonadota bacterium]